MEKYKRILLTVASLVICLFILACQEQEKEDKETTIQLGTTIGQIAEFFTAEAIEVEGFSLVGGLRGTGSAQCPPQVRAYLEQYILKNLPGSNVGALIDSRDTAVVYVYGTIPPMASKGQRFDLKVLALEGTETTSLDGGALWGVDLRVRSRYGSGTKVLATGNGSIYIDKLEIKNPDKRSGYVLNGGEVLDDYIINIAIRETDYKLTSVIRDRINGRFGSNVAKPTTPGQIELSIPPQYKQNKQKFVALVRATFLDDSAQIKNERVDRLISSLITSQDKARPEILIEAVGNYAADKVAPLLTSIDPEVRFRAARILLNTGDDRGQFQLRQIAFDKTSPFRLEAIKTIGQSARRNVATVILQSLLRDDDFDIKLAAYEELSKMNDILITRKLIGRNFYLEMIAVSGNKKYIYVTRTGTPRIVLFGVPIFCLDGSFAQSDDGNITINALPGAENVSLTRQITGLPPITIQSSHRLSNIIERLCEEATIPDDSPRQPGLNIPYADMVALLKQMSEKGIILAEFKAGKLVQID